MARPIKNRVINARVDDRVYAQLMTYCEHTDIDLSDLIRESVNYYIRKNPVKKVEE